MKIAIASILLATLSFVTPGSVEAVPSGPPPFAILGGVDCEIRNGEICVRCPMPKIDINIDDWVQACFSFLIDPLP